VIARNTFTIKGWYYNFAPPLIAKALAYGEKMNTEDNINKNEFYDIALSFAGEDRRYVETVANILREKKVNVFYDLFSKVDLWGKDLFQYLNNIYQNKSVYTVVFISKHYKNKRWTSHELKSAQSRAFDENKEYILPARFDDTDIPGVNKMTGYLDLNSIAPDELAIMICQKLDGLATSLMGRTYFDDEDSLYEISINKLLAAIEWCHRNNKYQEVITLGRKVDFYLKKEMQWSKRKKYLYLSLDAATKLGAESRILDIKRNIAAIAMNQGDFEESINMSKEILIVAEKHRDNSELFDSYHALGRVFEAKGDYGNAKKYYNKALEVSKKFLSERNSSNTIHELAVVMYRMSDYKKAEELYKEAIDIADMTGFAFIKSCSLHGLGLLYQYKNTGIQDITFAENYYNKSLEIKKTLGNQEEIARTEYQLADLYYDKEKYDEALELISHCVDIFEKTDHRYLIQARQLKRQIIDKKK